MSDYKTGDIVGWYVLDTESNEIVHDPGYSVARGGARALKKAFEIQYPDRKYRLVKAVIAK